MKEEMPIKKSKEEKKQENKITQMETEITHLKSRVNSLTGIFKSVSDRMNNIEQTPVEKYLQSAKKDAKEIHDKYRLLFFKQTVATEVLFLAKIKHPDLASVLAVTVFRAFDESEEWWLRKENYTLGQWTKALIDLSAKYKEMDQEFQLPDLVNIGMEKIEGRQQ